jgi:hypothetical protein
MLERHDIAVLLDTAREALRRELLDALPPERRHTALMIANALAIASRHVSAAALPGDDDAQAAAVRAFSGAAAEARQLHAELLARNRAELAITNPKLLKPA